MDDPRAYLLATFQLPPPICVNSSDSKDFARVYQTCYGDHDFKYSIIQVFELVQELLDHHRVLYYVNEFVLALFLWRGSHSVTVAGKQWWFPVNSLCAFIMAITLVEKPWLLPSFSFLTFGWMLTSSMRWRNNHPNPWWRCHTFLQLLRMLLLGKGVSPEKIEANERAARRSSNI